MVFSAVVKMPSIELQRVVRDLYQFDEAMVISCNEKGFKFSATNNMGTMNIGLSHAATVEMQKPISLTVSCRNLSNVLDMSTNESVLGGQVSLSMAPDAPLVGEYGVGEIGHIKFYLDPIDPIKKLQEEKRKLQEENWKLQRENRKLLNENETFKQKESEFKPKFKQEEENDVKVKTEYFEEDQSEEVKKEVVQFKMETVKEEEEEDKENVEDRVDCQNNGVGGDEDVNKKAAAVKSKSVNISDDENQNNGGFSQDGRPDPPEAGPPPTKAPRRSSRGLQSL